MSESCPGTSPSSPDTGNMAEALSQEPARKTALFISAFFDELVQCGVQEVVISPGSRSTPLAMVAYESPLRVYVDIDERGAAFFASGLAKASDRPVAVICTSGTAVANLYPAILEAECSRVPLIVLTGDRPPRLQNLGAPQTCDQLKIFGDHVRHFQQMPLPGCSGKEIAFARQMALVAYAESAGTAAGFAHRGEEAPAGSRRLCMGNAGPVHFNFPFEEPLKPDLSDEALFSIGRRVREMQYKPLVGAAGFMDSADAEELGRLIGSKRCLVLCGEGSAADQEEAHALLAWSRERQLPLLADPLSGLRSYDDPLVIDGYDAVFGGAQCPSFDLVIRFGRYPVSKACFTDSLVNAACQIVVDAVETRDFNAATDIFVRMTPAAFVAALSGAAPGPAPEQRSFAASLIEANKEAKGRIQDGLQSGRALEGCFVSELMECIPECACLFSASSMAIRLVDTYYAKSAKNLAVFCNRGLNGIDGTVSTALGVAQHFEHTTLLVGDLALLHDVNALALQQELRRAGETGAMVGSGVGQRGLSPLSQKCDKRDSPLCPTPAPVSQGPSIVIVLLNNHGGAIFELLPQYSEEAYFKRLFTTPQTLDFAAIAQGFGVPYHAATTCGQFRAAYEECTQTTGISLIEIDLPDSGLSERYGNNLT